VSRSWASAWSLAAGAAALLAAAEGMRRLQQIRAVRVLGTIRQTHAVNLSGQPSATRWDCMLTTESVQDNSRTLTAIAEGTVQRANRSATALAALRCVRNCVTLWQVILD
jgi:hypothetical protein